MQFFRRKNNIFDLCVRNISRAKIEAKEEQNYRTAVEPEQRARKRGKGWLRQTTEECGCAPQILRVQGQIFRGCRGSSASPALYYWQYKSGGRRVQPRPSPARAAPGTFNRPTYPTRRQRQRVILGSAKISRIASREKADPRTLAPGQNVENFSNDVLFHPRLRW